MITSRDLKDLYSQDITIADSHIGQFDVHNQDLVGYLRQMTGDYLMKNGLAIESGPSVPDWMIAGPPGSPAILINLKDLYFI